MSTYLSISYLDVRIRVYYNESILSLHLLAIPMHESHTGEAMFDAVVPVLGVLCPNWRDVMLGVTTDGERKMTVVNKGLATRFQKSIEKRNYTEETMFGVASILCRLGVRPLSTSALASRVVADFMAILVYVNYEMDGYLSTYASDPVFTLGAIKVWYELKNGLAKYILLQLEKLILKETLDTGGVGEMVARILLLLAMDTCVLGGGGDSPDYNRIGQFVPLETFLEKFITEDMPIYYEGKKNPVEYLRPAFDEWRSK
ncbi:hypothetical protein DVH05_021832 [Phytophthora capsici]|nr:hypothetical protein DVH05_021832 [Phytophthora capsici]